MKKNEKIIEILFKVYEKGVKHKNCNLDYYANRINKALSITAVVQAKPEKVFDVHSCINEICYAANMDSCLFNDNINNNSFRFKIKKAIDKLIYAK